MPNQIPFSGATNAAGGYVLPKEQGEILTNGLLQRNGVISLAGDARTTSARKTEFPIWLGQPTAGFVGEGAPKPVTGGEFGQAVLNVKKVASIVLFTDEQIEDLQDGDVNVLIDGGVRDAIADVIDAHALGLDSGGPIATAFDNALASSTLAVEYSGGQADGLQAAVSAAMGKLEANGYDNPENLAVCLHPAFRQVVRDAKDSEKRALYGAGNDPLYGLQRTFSTNLESPFATPAAGEVIGVVVHKPNLHVRIRHDVRVAVSREATVNDGSQDRKLFQENLTAIRYETRLGFIAHDLNRAVCLIKNEAA